MNNMELMLKIKVRVPMSAVFEQDQEIHNLVKGIFRVGEDWIEEGYNIYKVLLSDSAAFYPVEYLEVLAFFKPVFLQNVVNIAVKQALESQRSLKATIKRQLTEENLRKEARGRSMAASFVEAIMLHRAESESMANVQGRAIYLLQNVLC